MASLTLSFGLVSIPVKLYAATESSAAIRFNLLAKDGSRLKQQYVSEKDQAVVARADMVKGYEFEKDRFVLFTPAELKALEEASSPAIEIIAFIPERSVDPLYYDKAYLLAPDKRGGKPYALLAEALRQSGRCALARWAWKTRQLVVQVRAVDDGLVLQQLLYADEVRSLQDLHVEPVAVTASELQLALQLIEQTSQDAYDPTQHVDEERQRILAAIDEKIAGKEVVASAHDEAPVTGQVIDLMEALRASLGKQAADKSGATAPAKAQATGEAKEATKPATTAAAKKAHAAPAKERKGARRAAAPKPEETGQETSQGKLEPAAPAPARVRARK